MVRAREDPRELIILQVRVLAVILGACILIAGIVVLIGFLSDVRSFAYAADDTGIVALACLLVALIPALGLAIIVIGVRAGRGWKARRVARGHCPKCGYDLRGNAKNEPGCPECGWGRGEVVGDEEST